MAKQKQKRQQDKPCDRVEPNQNNCIDNDNSACCDLEAQVDQIAALPAPKKRIWEIDFLRGLLILFVIMDHLFHDVVIFQKYYQTEFWQWLGDVAAGYRKSTTDFGAIRALTHDTFVYLFLLLSGVSSSFSRNNFKRGLKMAVFACLFSAATYAFSSILNQKLTIIFNIIHVIALSVLVWSGLEFAWSLCKRNWQKNLFGSVIFFAICLIFLVGYKYAAAPKENIDWTFIFVKHRAWATITADVWWLFPSLGWFFIGGFLGKFLYKERTTLFPSVNSKWVAPLTFVGRHSLWFYFLSQVLMYGFIYLFAFVWGVL